MAHPARPKGQPRTQRHLATVKKHRGGIVPESECPAIKPHQVGPLGHRHPDLRQPFAEQPHDKITVGLQLADELGEH